MARSRYKGLSFLVGIIALSTLLTGKPAMASEVRAPNWDRTLLSLRLEGVKVEAASLLEAWQIVSQRHMVRSILLISKSAAFQKKFLLDRDSLTVGQLLDAMVTAYPDFRWTQDPRTGIVWIHPRDAAYETLLGEKIEVEVEQLGVPMQSGILEALGSASSLGVTAKPWNELFLNTFDYPVDVPQGAVSVRDLLNLCATENPTKTYLIEITATGSASITAVNLVSDTLDSPPEGAVHWWHTEIGATRGHLPSKEELLAVLSGDDARRRKAARAYLEAVIWQAPFDEWVSSIAERDQALWFSLALLDILVRRDLATEAAAVNRLRLETTTKFFEEGPLLLGVLAALELARVGKDRSALDRVEKRKDLFFQEDAREELVSEIARIVRRSEQARSLVGRSPILDRLGASPSIVGLMSRSLLFRLGRIEKN